MQNFVKSLSMSLTNGNMIRSQFLATKKQHHQHLFSFVLNISDTVQGFIYKKTFKRFFFGIIAIFKIKERFDHS